MSVNDWKTVTTYTKIEHRVTLHSYGQASFTRATKEKVYAYKIQFRLYMKSHNFFFLLDDSCELIPW